MNRCTLALTLLTLGLSTAHAEPRAVAVVLDAPPADRQALEATTRTAHGLLYGLAAIGDAERVVVRVITPAGASDETAQASAWLGEVGAWAAGERKAGGDAKGKGLRAAVEHLGAAGVDHAILIDAAGGDGLEAALTSTVDGPPVTALTLDGERKPGDGCPPDAGARCEVVPVDSDLLGAVQTALARALDGVPGVWVTTADALDLPPGTRRAVVIAPGATRPVAGADPLIAADEAPDDRLMIGALLRGPVGDAKPTLVGGVERALVVGVRAPVEVFDCAVQGTARPRWQVAGAEPGAIAGQLRFEVSGHGRLPAEADGTVALPEGLVGAFTVQPVWVEGGAPAGPPARCRVDPATRARATLSVARVDDGGGLEARVAFTGPDGAALDPTGLRAHLPPVSVSGGPSAALTAADGAATARLPLPGPGTHTVQIPAVATRHLLLEGSRVEVRVEPPTEGGAVAWWPAPLAAGLVLFGLLGYPAALGLLRRRQRPPVGSVRVSVGGSPVIDRRIGPNTAFPAMLVGVRDIPIADGETLARAEVRWDGLRPMVVATVMGRPDAEGRCTPRFESCRLDEARPFTFSNVRIEFVENG